MDNLVDFSKTDFFKIWKKHLNVKTYFETFLAALLTLVLPLQTNTLGYHMPLKNV